MSKRVPVQMLPFEVKLEIIDDRRRLMNQMDSILPQSPTSLSSIYGSSTNTKSSIPSYEELFGETNTQLFDTDISNVVDNNHPTTERMLETYRDDSSSSGTGAFVDTDVLTYLLEQYFFNSFSTALAESTSLANLDQIHLPVIKNQRRQLSSNDNDIEPKSSISSDSHRNLRQNHPKPDALPISHLSTTKQQQQQQQRNQLTISSYSFSYNGYAIFERDGVTPIPEKNYVQSLQLQAFTGLNDALLTDFEGTEPASGLLQVSSVSASIITVPIDDGMGLDNDVDEPSTTKKSKFDVIIIVAIAVASCSLTLLACALLLAFRRRKQSGAGGSYVDPNNNNGPHGANSVEKLNLRIPVGEPSNTTSPTKKTGSEISPTTVMAPPVFEMNVDNNHEDDISEYTESLFSAPIGNTGNTTGGGGTKTKNGYMAPSSSAKNENSSNQRSDGAATGAGAIGGLAKVSSRFNPRYILGSKSGTDSEGGDSDIIGNLQPAGGSATQPAREMDGVPPLATPVRKALQSSGTLHSSTNDGGRRGSGGTPITPNSVSSSSPAGLPRDRADSGLYPEGVIDDDIASSLKAYKEAERAKAMNRRYQGSNAEESMEDGLSLSSAESYGFSLDGNSTVANSTKYGY